MKKIVMIFAAMAAVLSSCQKSELESVSANDGKDIVLNISVSNPGADDTKALIKQGWVENDQIKIWFDTNTGDTPDLVIKYDGSSKWTQDGTANNVPDSGNGYVKAVYNNSVIVASKDNYTFENNTLTFNIAHWVFLTEVQVVVYGDDIDGEKPDKYTLSCDKFTPLAAGNGYTVGSDAITASTGNKGDAVTGISNTDGVAFVFATADYSTSSSDKKDFTFTLKDNTSGSEVTKVYKPNNVAIEAKTNNATIKALTITSIKFAAPGPEYVEMKMGASGNKTLKWATMNLGATTVAGSYTTCYGELYQWGSVNKLYTNFPWTSATAGSFTWETGKSDGFVAANREYTAIDATTLPDANDVVKQTYPGTNWRMPTSQEFKDLYDACVNGAYNRTKYAYIACGASTTISSKGVYWCGNYDGVKGCLFYDGTNRLFFPAAGYGRIAGLIDAGYYGYYWSSSLDTGDTDRAYRLRFLADGIYPQTNAYRNFGFSVRPVSE